METHPKFWSKATAKERSIAASLGVTVRGLETLLKHESTGRTGGNAWSRLARQGLVKTEGGLTDAGRDLVRRARQMGYALALMVVAVPAMAQYADPAACSQAIARRAPGNVVSQSCRTQFSIDSERCRSYQKSIPPTAEELKVDRELGLTPRDVAAATEWGGAYQRCMETAGYPQHRPPSSYRQCDHECQELVHQYEESARTGRPLPPQSPPVLCTYQLLAGIWFERCQ